jgi:hypothetical protein
MPATDHLGAAEPFQAAHDRDYHQLAAIGTGGGIDLKPEFRTANP